MPRAKKDGKCLNCIIERKIHERLEQYCETVGQTKTLAIERILKQFFDEYDRTNDKNVEEHTDD